MRQYTRFEGGAPVDQIQDYSETVVCPEGWVETTGQQTFDILAIAKAAKWDAIQAERDKRKVAGYRVNGHRFHSDPDSRIQQLGLVMMGANIPAGLMWKTIGGVFVPMIPELAQSIFATTAYADTAIFAAAEAHRATMAALTDAAAVAAYDHSSGWPEV